MRFALINLFQTQQKKLSCCFAFCCYLWLGMFFCTAVMANENTDGGQAEHVLTSNPPQLKSESPGKKVYERFCVVCHRDGLMGAPKFRDQAQWDKRLADRTIDDLVISVLKGKNAMPAKGTCYECSEDDIKSAVDYMMPQHD